MRNITKNELKQASVPKLKEICEEIRREIVQTVSACGGHLSSNLGAVELTVALHKVFDFPKDKLIFDVGHQCYTHKLLSGRAESFHTLRKEGGISGFPKRKESEYDCYETGHAGTALSAALGFSKARDLGGEDFDVIAFIGDGSFQNGLIYEALNSIRLLGARVLIVLNDNGMSISPTTGGAHDILGELKQGSASASDDLKLIERFGLRYMGVHNGNDVGEMTEAFSKAKEYLKEGSVLLHAVTKKGNGYAFSENAPELTHGVSPTKVKRNEYSTALGEELTRLAREDEKIVAVTAAMTDSLGLREFFKEFPNRAFDVGICEEHASVLCSSMAAAGLKPYYAIYSTFLQRAFDEIIHDVCSQDLPVTFCVDRAGITGADGETHQGVFDLSYLSFIPNLTVAIPSDIGEFRSMLRWSKDFSHPLAIRYPRYGTEGAERKIELGKFDIISESDSDIAVLAAGERCIKIAGELLSRFRKDGGDFTLINAKFLRPLDTELLSKLKQNKILTIEDNSLIGGLGDSVARFYRNSEKRVYSFGYKDDFIPHGTYESLSKKFGLDPEEIFSVLKGEK